MEPDYWYERFRETVDRAANAPSIRARMAYLELAAHYRSMHALTLEKGRPGDARKLPDPSEFRID